MTRYAFALTAILLLVLSAGFAHVQLRQAVADRSAVAGQARGQGRLIVADTSMLLDTQATRQVTPILAASADEGPAPALLVYFALVLLGSAAAIVFVRRGQGREL